MKFVISRKAGIDLSMRNLPGNKFPVTDRVLFRLSVGNKAPAILLLRRYLAVLQDCHA